MKRIVSIRLVGIIILSLVRVILFSFHSLVCIHLELERIEPLRMLYRSRVLHRVAVVAGVLHEQRVHPSGILAHHRHLHRIALLQAVDSRLEVREVSSLVHNTAPHAVHSTAT